MQKPENNNMEAKKATIYLGNIPLNVYQMPDGTYQLSLDSVTKVIGKKRRDLVVFMQSNSSLALPFKEYNIFNAPLVRIKGPEKFFKPIPIKLATSYWHYCSKQDNIKADALVQACMIESIERRADKIFRVQRTEEEYNQRWFNNYQEYQESLNDNRQEIKERRLPGDDFYLPIGINKIRF